MGRTYPLSSKNAFKKNIKRLTELKRERRAQMFDRPPVTYNDTLVHQHATSSGMADLEITGMDKILKDDYNIEVGNNNTSTKTPEKVEGRRIIDFSYLFNELKIISNHGPFACNLSNLEVVSEKRTGLKSKFHFKCNMCRKSFIIHSEPENVHFDLNYSAISGITAIGSGFSHLEQFLSAMEVPCMTQSYYLKSQRSIFNTWQDTAIECMENAAARERDAAIKEGRVDKNGTAMIDVAADGCWSRRSYGKNYSALSGAAAIVGKKFGEVLFMAVRNKYCCICARYEKKKLPVPAHQCFKNYAGSSTSMEADILVEGFKRSIDMHGVIYARVISDGDSSSYNRILQSRPYPSHTVEKIECKNHILRNFCNKLRLAATDTKYKLQSRKELKTERILSMRKVICNAIKYNKAQDNPLTENIDNLYTDIMNAPLHSFENHKNCKVYYCSNLLTAPQDKNIDIMLTIKNEPIWQRIDFITSSVAVHARSLIHDVDSNVVERFNGIIAKFIGGKRINYSLRQSYEGRCHAAVVSFNTGMPLSKLQKKILGRSPTGRLKRMESRRLKRLSTSKKYLRKKNRKLVLSYSTADYGEHCSKPDLPFEVFERRQTAFLDNLEENKRNREEIEKRTILQGDSSEWLELRRSILTASNFGKVVKKLEHTSCSNFVKSMLYPKSLSHVPSICHGKEHEKIALLQLSIQEGIDIQPCGLFIDANIPYLGATPDGISGDNLIVEVKCPIAAFKMGIDESIRLKKVSFWQYKENKLEINKKHHWYIQVQGQLHITMRDMCLFAVWSGKGIPLKTEYIKRDIFFWEDVMEEKLKRFYVECLLPELVDPRIPRNEKIREPVYILEAIKLKESTKRSLQSFPITSTKNRRLSFSADPDSDINTNKENDATNSNTNIQSGIMDKATVIPFDHY